MNYCHLALLIFLVQIIHGLTEEEAQCLPGFREPRYTFAVTRKVLERGRVLGKVSFEACSQASRALYSPEDTRFRIFPDGKVTVKRQLTLHDSYINFVLNAWDASGGKHSVPVAVWYE